MKVKPQLYNTLLRLLTTSDKVKARTMPKRVRTPNCTHVDMDRIKELVKIIARHDQLGRIDAIHQA